MKKRSSNSPISSSMRRLSNRAAPSAQSHSPMPAVSAKPRRLRCRTRSAGLDDSSEGEGLAGTVVELGRQDPERRRRRRRRLQPSDRARREPHVVGEHQHMGAVVIEQVLDADVHPPAVAEVAARVDGVHALVHAAVQSRAVVHEHDPFAGDALSRQLGDELGRWRAVAICEDDDTELRLLQRTNPRSTRSVRPSPADGTPRRRRRPFADTDPTTPASRTSRVGCCRGPGTRARRRRERR